MIRFFVFFSLIYFSCQNPSNSNMNQLPNDVRWVTGSEEYKMLCKQIYLSATRSIKREFSDTNNPVIIMDIDETVLDNSALLPAITQTHQHSLICCRIILPWYQYQFACDIRFHPFCQSILLSNQLLWNFLHSKQYVASDPDRLTSFDDRSSISLVGLELPTRDQAN